MLINTNGLSFLGPGSEWFWSMCQFIVVAVTLIGLYRQVRVSGTANALARFQALGEAWDSDTLTYCRLAYALRLRSNQADPGLIHVAAPICDFFESLFELELKGHIDEAEIEDRWGRSMQLWWALLESTIRAEEARQGATFYEGFERLSRRMADRERRRTGSAITISDADRPGWLDYVINANSERWQLVQSIKAGRLPKVPAPSTPSAS